MELLSEIFIVLAYIAAIGFFVFGVEDLLFDLQFLRYARRTSKARHTTIEELRAKPEKHIALFVPAWSEGDVVNRMADYAVKILEYDRYDIFIGVYPNDPVTIACVDALSRVNPRIHKAMCPNPGPTSKADCLNAIYRTMKLREIPGVREYGIIALHDAEDVLHPLTLKVYNYFVPDQFDMGQIPVFPLELPPIGNWVANCYMDEFSELHLKDMLARQEIGGVVPSAGVGTAFARSALDWLADHNEGDPFVVGNLTEDYFIGIQLKRAGFRCSFINYPIDRLVVKRDAEGEIVSRKHVTELVAVRESFPPKFWAAVRQRSRWILGISMQCWELAGWSGSMGVRYTLFRDRKAPLVHLINIIGYIVICSWFIELIFRALPSTATSYWRPLFTPDSFLWTLILIDTCLLFYRVLIKIYYVKQVYGWRHGLISIIRYPIANFINFFATCRAFWMYANSRLFGRQLVWLKTTHVFPGTSELSEFAASVGDLIMREGTVPRSRLSQLMQSETAGSIPLKLLQLRLLDEEQFTAIWSRFSAIPEKTIPIEETDARLLDQLPEETSIEHDFIPVKTRDDGHIEVAFIEPPSPELRQAVEQRYARPITVRLITPTNLRMLRERLYSTRAMRRYRPQASNAFPELEAEKRSEARKIQFRTGRRFSDLVVDLQFVPPDEVRRVWSELFRAEPCVIANETLDRGAYEALGPVFCSLHKLAPLEGRRLIFQDSVHPAALREIEARLGYQPTPVTDLAQPVRNFLRGVFGTMNPEEMLIDRMVSDGTLTAAKAEELRALKAVVSDPAHVLIPKFGLASSEDTFRAFTDVARLPEAETSSSRDVPEGVLRPDFEETTGSRILEAHNGQVTIGLRNLLAPRDFSHVCTRLMLCAVRFVRLPSA